jgi:hypothetical protein
MGESGKPVGLGNVGRTSGFGRSYGGSTGAMNNG